MIAYLKGKVISLHLDRAIIDVRDVGYQVYATPNLLASWSLGQEIAVYTSLVVREDAWTLYAFENERDRSIFELLQTVSGFGPRIALATLGIHNTESLAQAVSAKDVKALTRVPGVGPKSAQRLLLELEGKLPDFGLGVSGGGTGGVRVQELIENSFSQQVIDALVSLGWSEKVAAVTVTEVSTQHELRNSTDVAEVLKLSLKQLGAKRG